MESVVIAITAKSQGVDEQLAKTKNKMDKLNQSILPQSANKNVNRIKQSLSGLGKMGDSVGGQLGRVASGLTSLLNPIGLITAGIGAAITLGVKLYQSLTMSHEQYMTYMQDKLNASNARLAKLDKTQKEDNGYFERLKQLNKVESLSNAIKTQAITIISILTARYGDLGLTIDDTTGKILGLDQAFEKISKRTNNTRLKQLKQQIQLSRGQLLSAYKNSSAWYDILNWKTWGQLGKIDPRQLFKPKSQQQGTLVDATDFLGMSQHSVRPSLNTPKYLWKNLTDWVKNPLNMISVYGLEQQKQNFSQVYLGTDQIKKAREIAYKWNNPFYGFSEQQKNQIAYIEKQIKLYEQKNSTEEADVEQLKRLREKLSKTKQLIVLQNRLGLLQQAMQINKTNSGDYNRYKQMADAMREYIVALQKYNEQSEKTDTGSIARAEKAKKSSQQYMLILQKINELRKQTLAHRKASQDAIYSYQFSRMDKGEKYNELDTKITSKREETQTLEDRNKQLELQLSKVKAERDALNNKRQGGTLTASEFDKILQLNERIAKLQKQIQENTANQAEIEKEITALTLQRQNIVDDLKKQHDNAVKTLQEQLQLEQNRNSMTDKEIEKQRILNRLRRQGYDKIPDVDIEQMAEDEAEKTIKLRKQKAMRDISDNYINEQMDLQGMLSGDYKSVASTRWSRQLKARGINSNDPEFNVLKDKRADLNRLKIANSFKDALDQMAYALEPNKKEAVKNRRIRQYQLQYGFDFDDDKKAKLGQIVDLEFQMEKLKNQSLNLSQYEVKTNQLTRRGGFAQGAVVISKTDQINSQIKNKAEQQVNLLKQIKDLIADVSKI